jgi:serine/threonine protein kinase
VAILPGKRLGPYEILPVLVSAEWVRCTAPAIPASTETSRSKFCQHILADRSDLRERLEREARAISSLNHPHICTLHDVGHQDGIDYLVMEYVDGVFGTARRFQLGSPMGRSRSSRRCSAIEIADALDKAHRRVTHRDLKPGEHHADRVWREATGFWTPYKTKM